MKPSTTLLALSGAVLVGVAIGYVISLPKGKAPLADLDRVEKKEAEDNLSPIRFSAFYIRNKNSVELRFDGKVALVDGEVCTNEKLNTEIRRAKDRKGARYLMVIGGEKDSFGTIVEAVGKYRALGFEEVVLMANVDWVDFDGYHRAHSEWLRSP